jgi:aquaporin Z
LPAYVLSQIVGGVLGVMTAALILGEAVADPSVQYAATVPGETGAIVAFAAELFIAFVLMSTVLYPEVGEVIRVTITPETRQAE